MKQFMAVLVLGLSFSLVWTPVALAQERHRLFFYQNESDIDTLQVSNGKQLFVYDTDSFYSQLKEEVKISPEALRYLDASEHHLALSKTFFLIDLVLIVGGAITMLASIPAANSSNSIPVGTWVGAGAVVASIPFAILGTSHVKKSFYNLNRAVNAYNGDHLEEKRDTLSRTHFGLGFAQGQMVGALQYSF